MVTAMRGDRGTTTRGCLVTLLIFVAVVYYGFHIGEVYLRHYRIEEEMRSQARLARGLTDEAIKRRLLAFADSLLPEVTHRVTVRRTERPRRITIQGEYRDSVDLPFFKRGYRFRPRAEAPL